MEINRSLQLCTVSHGTASRQLELVEPLMCTGRGSRMACSCSMQLADCRFEEATVNCSCGVRQAKSPFAHHGVFEKSSVTSPIHAALCWSRDVTGAVPRVQQRSGEDLVQLKRAARENARYKIQLLDQPDA